MPRQSSDLGAQFWARLLVLGAPKSGKTTTCITTAPGPVYVINSDDEYSLRPASAHGGSFAYDNAYGNERGLQAIDLALKEAHRGVHAKQYTTIVWDTITRYSARAEAMFEDASRSASGQADGRKFWPAHRKHILQCVDRLLALPAHVIILAHYQDKYRDQEGNAPPVREGIVPALGGKLSADVPGLLSDVVYMDRDPQTGDRYFACSSRGVYGPGGRSLRGVERVEGNLSKLIETMQSNSSKKEGTK